MLPDLPKLKSRIMEAVLRQLRGSINQKMGFFGEIPRQTLCEGDRMRVIRNDGSVEESAFHRLSAEGAIDEKDVPGFSSEERQRRIDELAESMATQMTQTMMDSLNKTLDAKGQTVNLAGRPLDPEAIFQLLEKIHIDFKPDGSPSSLSIVVPPNLREQFEVCLRSIEETPELKTRHEAILQRKREDWRDREAARKLVG